MSVSSWHRIGGSKNNAFSGAATIGSGSAHRVISLSFDGGNDAVITPDGLDVMSHWQVYGGYSHYWTESLNSAVTVAWAELDNSEFQPGTATLKGRGGPRQPEVHDEVPVQLSLRSQRNPQWRFSVP